MPFFYFRKVSSSKEVNYELYFDANFYVVLFLRKTVERKENTAADVICDVNPIFGHLMK